MFIIFGWGHVTQKNYGPTYPVECNHCQNDTYWNLTRVRTWFTLFFLPVIPYQTEYILHCGVCNSGTRLRGEQIDQALEVNETTTRYLNQELTEEEYGTELAEIQL